MSENQAENLSENQEQTTQQPQAEVKKKKYTRMQSVCDILKASRAKAGIDKATLSKKANERYAAEGGKDNPSESSWAVNYALAVLREFNVIAEDDDGKIIKT